MPEPTATKWTARISRDPDKWSRIEVDGAGAESEPIALVKDPAHARAIAAQPEVVRSLNAILTLLAGTTVRVDTDSSEAADRWYIALDRARGAIAKAEGR